MIESIIDIHNLIQEVIVYIVLGVAGILGVAIRHYFSGNFRTLHIRVDNVNKRLNDLCDKMDDHKEETDKLKKSMRHLATFEMEKIKTFHSDANFHRDLKTEIENILD